MVFDAKSGSAEKDTISELGRHALRDDLRTTNDSLILSTSVVEDHWQQATGRAQVVQDPKQRNALRIAGPDRAGDQTENRRREARRCVLAEPIPERRAIEASGTIHAPWFTNRHLLAETVELPGDLREVGGFGETDVRQKTARDRAFDVVRGVAFVVGIEGADAELADQGSHAVLARTDPLPADLHDMPAANGHVERASAYAIACLEHEKRIHSAPA
jgi:hypothetical protein